ncbi:MAG: hypothetical protein WCB85_15025, partial [Candidatus Dormiibacterota bacterium]
LQGQVDTLQGVVTQRENVEHLIALQVEGMRVSVQHQAILLEAVNSLRTAVAGAIKLRGTSPAPRRPRAKD